jgi:hypothetical protein
LGIVGTEYLHGLGAFTLERFNFILHWHENGEKKGRMKIKCFIMAMVMVSLGLCANAQNAQNAQDTYQNTPPARSVAYPSNNDYVNRVGVGLEFGAPIGVNAKYWLTDNLAVDGLFGWSPFSHSTLEIHADFLVHNFNLVKLPTGQLPLYVGMGLLGRVRDDGRGNLAGFRFPIGASYMFENFPIDIYGEFAPEIIFAPFSRGSFDIAVGIRYWF